MNMRLKILFVILCATLVGCETSKTKRSKTVMVDEKRVPTESLQVIKLTPEQLRLLESSDQQGLTPELEKMLGLDDPDLKGKYELNFAPGSLRTGLEKALTKYGLTDFIWKPEQDYTVPHSRIFSSDSLYLVIESSIDDYPLDFKMKRGADGLKVTVYSTE